MVIKMNMINIINPCVASHLKSLGFKCREQNISNQKVFIFLENPDLLNLLKESFSKQDFFISPIMNF